MTQKPLEPSKIKSVLRTIRESMEVYDSQNHHVGKVEELYFGADSDEMVQHGAGAATAPNPDLRETTLVDDVANALFGEDDLPEEIRQRLINEGFLRIDAPGLFAADRYVLPEQIADVQDDHVQLNVTREGFLKK